MKSKNNKLIILDIVDKTIMRNKYVAISKPRTDVVAILKKRGFILKQINYLSSYNTTLLKKVIQYINFIIIICNFYQHFHKIKECYIFIQYPFTAFFSDRIKKYIFNFLHRRKNRIIVLFHDIEGLRYNKPNKFEKFCIENSDVCIFHTKEMEQKIRESGINVKRSVYLEFFDYLNSIEVADNPTDGPYGRGGIHAFRRTGRTRNTLSRTGAATAPTARRTLGDRKSVV